MKCVLVATLAIACSQPAVRDVPRQPSPSQSASQPVAPPPIPGTGAVTISIVGTNDLHGALERLPLLAGFLANLRAARAADHGGVLVIDAGDMFQGTLESNLGEGADVVRAYNAIGYAGVAVGNHEFDYGPAGLAVTATSIEDDAQGALKARAREAKFPFLVANIIDRKSGQRIKWPNMPASTLVQVAGIPIGIIGASTESTPYTTMPANFAGLAVTPPGPAIAAEAKLLRERGAKVIVVVAHIGSACKELDHPEDASSCDKSEELFKLIADLPKGTVDVIAAGHTHAGIANRIEGIAVIESFSSGRAFGRVDLRVAADGRVTSMIFRPHDVCALDKDGNAVAVARCKPGDYEGKPVIADRAVASIVDAALARAGDRRKEKLGVTITATVAKSYGVESAEGDLFCDLMLAARRDAEVAMTNGGGLRADLPAGELTYGQLFEALPFDNRFAIVELTGKHLRSLVGDNLKRDGGIFSWGGLTAKASCKAGQLDLQITVAGKPLVDTRTYKLVTSDFLASGGDGVIGRLKLPDHAVQITEVNMREAIADVLRRNRGSIDPKQFTAKRLDYAGDRPIECGGGKARP